MSSVGRIKSNSKQRLFTYYLHQTEKSRYKFLNIKMEEEDKLLCLSFLQQQKHNGRFQNSIDWQEKKRKKKK